MNKYYLAYGSNLSMAQMAQRCPDAVYVGTAELKDYQLLFKGSQSGSYLTVEPKKGSMVPVLVWRISERDEHYLDRYEGYPSFYYKKTMEVEVQSFIGEKTDDVTEAIIYIMHERKYNRTIKSNFPLNFFCKVSYNRSRHENLFENLPVKPDRKSVV